MTKRPCYRYLFVSHLRGRVTGPTPGPCTGRPVWRVEVINTKTGALLNSDDAYSLQKALDDATERVHAARSAWFYGFARKALR